MNVNVEQVYPRADGGLGRVNEPLTDYHVHIQRHLLPLVNQLYPQRTRRMRAAKSYTKNSLEQRLSTAQGRRQMCEKLLKRDDKIVGHLWPFEP